MAENNAEKIKSWHAISVKAGENNQNTTGWPTEKQQLENGKRKAEKKAA